MKKLFILIFVTVLSTCALYSQDNFDYSKFNGISIGGGATVTSDISGGFFDFGFNFYSKDTTTGNFSIRNYIEVMGGGFASGTGGYGILGFRERIIFAGITPITDGFGIRTYGGIDFGISFYAGDNGVDNKTDLFEEPFILEPRGFGGIEFLSADRNGRVSGSVFVEAGGGGRIFVAGNKNSLMGITGGSAFINFGGRTYF